MSFLTSFFSQSSNQSSNQSSPTSAATIRPRRLLELDDDTPAYPPSPIPSGHETQPPKEPSSPPQRPEQKPQPHDHPVEDRRPQKAPIILAAGLSFFALSLLITRRSFLRKRLAAKPSFYTDSAANTAAQSQRTSGAMEAVEALNIATINVLSVGMMGLGSAMWYLGIEDMSDARRVMRSGMGVDEQSEEEQQEEFEEWIASALARKEQKDEARRRVGTTVTDEVRRYEDGRRRER